MQLTMTTEYALRIVIYIASHDGIVNAQEISDNAKIPHNFINKLSIPLRKAGIVKTIKGQKGGYFLGKQPKDISLYEIIDVMEDTNKISRCLEDGESCHLDESDDCPIRNEYKQLQSLLDNECKKVTIDRLV